MNRIITIILLYLCFSVSQVIAGESQGGVLRYWMHHFSDHFIFEVENKIARPSCDTIGPVGRYAIDVRQPKGKALMSIIVTAKATNSFVHVVGSGDCTVYGDSEDISHVMVE
ncbi:MAG: hypothetical protein ABW090_08215 [Sedimenticola sp.]